MSSRQGWRLCVLVDLTIYNVLYADTASRHHYSSVLLPGRQSMEPWGIEIGREPVRCRGVPEVRPTRVALSWPLRGEGCMSPASAHLASRAGVFTFLSSTSLSGGGAAG